MTNKEIEKRFKFDLELELGIYKVKYTKNNKIVYFVLEKDSQSYIVLEKFKIFLNNVGYRRVGYSERYSNTIKIYLNKGTYRVVNSAPYFNSKETPKNKIPEFIKDYDYEVYF